MVQTYQSPVRIYKYPFEVVMAAYEMRFPTCPQIPIFVGSEITYEYKSNDGAEWVIDRKCQLNVDAPYLVKKIAGVDYVYFNQKNSLNRRKRTLHIEATNISFASRIVVQENCTYYVHAENEDWTCFEQSASLDVKSFFGFEAAVEKLAVKQYAANLAKGKEILEFFIDELLKGGTSHIERFKDPEGEEVPESVTDREDSSDGDVVIVASKTASLALAGLTSNTSGDHDEDVPKTVRAASFDDDCERMRAQANPHLILSLPLAMPKPSSLVPSTAATSTPAAHHQTLLEKKYDRTGRQRRSVKFFIADSKLEAEYIRRFLGQLNPLEESRLCELKYTLQNQHKGKLPNDAHLLRFLRAREFDVSKAKDMVHTSILWRKQHNVDKILEEWRPSSVITQYFPGCWHNSDKEGRPLYVLRFGQLDTKGLLRSCGVDNLVKLTLCVCEEGLQRTAEATKKLGVPISSWSLLVDLEGLSMRHVWRPGVQCLLKIIEIVEANYPETMGQVLVIRAPRVFPVMWTLISPFIDERTRKKFMISGASDLKEELRKHIDEKFIPDHLGGPCLTNCGHGGHVPKNLYRPVEETELGASGSDDPLDSTYTATSTSKGCPVEVVIDVLTAGSVLTWDFDVVKNDCEFTVYFSQTKVSAAKEPHSPTMLKPVEMVSAAIGGSSHHPPTVSCAPDLVVGKDLYVEEKAVIFQEGDSMQGSHYCSRAGSYILQWKLPDSQASSSAFDFGSHKCRFMYFYEILNSADFRGSVASLESCRSSSFSSLAPPSPTTPVSRKS